MLSYIFIEIYIKPQFYILFYILCNIICSLLLLTKEQIQFSLPKEFNENKTKDKKPCIKNRGLNEWLSDVIMKKKQAWNTSPPTIWKNFILVFGVSQRTGTSLLNTKPHWVIVLEHPY